jgi:thiol-disulfide isomerase/thioredoxin
MDRKLAALGLLASSLVGAAALALWLAGKESAPSQSAATTSATAHANAQSGDGAAVTLSYPALLATQIRDMQGNPQSIGQWQGKLLVINFWATWCGPCKEEMPYFDEIFREYSGSGLQIIGIAADPPQKVTQFLEQVKVSYPLFPDQEGALAFSRRAGNRVGVLPHTLIYNSSGELILNKLGQLSKEDLTLIARENLRNGSEKRAK